MWGGEEVRAGIIAADVSELKRIEVCVEEVDWVGGRLWVRECMCVCVRGVCINTLVSGFNTPGVFETFMKRLIKPSVGG